MDDRGAPGGLHGLVKTERNELVTCWARRTEAALATAPLPRPELVDHMPALVDDLGAALYPGAIPLSSTGTNHARSHGDHRLRLGFDVWEVVREYGFLEECVIERAARANVAVTPREHKMLSTWLNRAIADAVAQYVRQRDAEHERQASEHLGFLAHELRNPIYAARLAFARLRGAELAGGGRTVEVLDRGLRRTSQLIEDALIQTSLRLGREPKVEHIDLPSFIEDIEHDAAIDGQARDVRIEVAIPAGLAFKADSRLLRSLLTNLIANAVKFSRPNTAVHIEASRSDGGVSIQIADACGGLPPGKADELFKPLVQRSPNQSGYGLGLAIAAEAAAALAADITVRDVPGRGCVFAVTLPAAPGPIGSG